MTDGRMSKAEAKMADIEERLTRMEVQLAQVGIDCDDTKKLLRKVVYGENGHPGFTVRMDRLEQWKGTATRFLWLLFGCFGSIGSAIAIYFATR